MRDVSWLLDSLASAAVVRLRLILERRPETGGV
jgi:hypothetical protein